ncbi:MAG: hypothetical protein C0490_06010 [Marivirga sp.]|nr:hypothetical protein [Marivirga sp.]
MELVHELSTAMRAETLRTNIVSCIYSSLKTAIILGTSLAGAKGNAGRLAPDLGLYLAEL